MKRAARGKQRGSGGKQQSGWTKQGADVHARETGAHGWLHPIREATYARLVPRELSEAETPIPASIAPVEPTPPPAPNVPEKAPKGAKKARGYRSRLHPSAGEEILAAPPNTVWEHRLSTYHRRRQDAAPAPGLPGPPVPTRWTPLGVPFPAGTPASSRPTDPS